MSDNAQKTPLAQSLGLWQQKGIASALQLLNKALPCKVVSVSGAIITVSFAVNSPFTLPQVSIPLFGPEYIRYPIQPGDLGMTIAADARLGGVSGLSSAVADLVDPANLTALAFLPLGNAEWSAVNPQALVMYGPDGVVLRDSGSSSTFVLTPTTIAINTPNSFMVTCGGTTLTLTPAGWSLTGTAGNIQDGTNHTSPSIMNAAWIALVSYINSHLHTNGNGGANTGAPTSPFTGGSIAPT